MPTPSTGSAPSANDHDHDHAAESVQTPSARSAAQPTTPAAKRKPIAPEVFTDERRAFQRFDLMAQVRVKRGTVDYVMDLFNISEGGALLDLGTMRAPKWLECGRVVEIFILHPENLDAIALHGKVLRLQRAGKHTAFAVKFVQLTEDSSAALKRLIALGRRAATSSD